VINKERTTAEVGTRNPEKDRDGTRGFENGVQMTGDHVNHEYHQVEGEPISAAIIKTNK